MLLNVSYNNKEITRKIDAEVGKPFTLKERWAMGGIGSPRLFITETSIEIKNLQLLDNDRDSLLETFALIIPYYKLTIYKGDLAVYSIYRDQYFIKVQSDTKAVQKFFKKLLDYKADNAPTSIEDL